MTAATFHGYPDDGIKKRAAERDAKLTKRQEWAGANQDKIVGLIKAAAKDKPAKEYLTNLAENGRVGSPHDGALLWGGTDRDGTGLSNRALAEAWAARHNAQDEARSFTLLEQTPAGRKLDSYCLAELDRDSMRKLGLDKKDVEGFWDTISRRYADQATGRVRVFNNHPFPKSVFGRIEAPGLRTNPEVGVDQIEFANPPPRTVRQNGSDVDIQDELYGKLRDNHNQAAFQFLEPDKAGYLDLGEAHGLHGDELESYLARKRSEVEDADSRWRANPTNEWGEFDPPASADVAAEPEDEDGRTAPADPVADPGATPGADPVAGAGPADPDPPAPSDSAVSLVKDTKEPVAGDEDSGGPVESGTAGTRDDPDPGQGPAPTVVTPDPGPDQGPASGGAETGPASGEDEPAVVVAEPEQKASTTPEPEPKAAATPDPGEKKTVTPEPEQKAAVTPEPQPKAAVTPEPAPAPEVEQPASSGHTASADEIETAQDQAVSAGAQQPEPEAGGGSSDGGETAAGPPRETAEFTADDWERSQDAAVSSGTQESVSQSETVTAEPEPGPERDQGRE
ncbi:MAG TPA: hypothetical protein VN408_40370 [Actinoplanes sp.]|nr:hypothetical protein [Actinoplanes sp.]